MWLESLQRNAVRQDRLQREPCEHTEKRSQRSTCEDAVRTEPARTQSQRDAGDATSERPGQARSSAGARQPPATWSASPCRTHAARRLPPESSGPFPVRPALPSVLRFCSVHVTSRVAYAGQDPFFPTQTRPVTSGFSHLLVYSI